MTAAAGSPAPAPVDAPPAHAPASPPVLLAHPSGLGRDHQNAPGRAPENVRVRDGGVLSTCASLHALNLLRLQSQRKPLLRLALRSPLPHAPHKALPVE